MTDYCAACGDASPEDGDKGTYMEFEPTRPNVGLYVELWVCSDCVNDGVQEAVR